MGIPFFYLSDQIILIIFRMRKIDLNNGYEEAMSLCSRLI